MKIVQILKQNYILTTILILGAALRIYHIDFQSIWLDELITMNECDPKLSFKETHAIISVWENNPIFYYYLVKINSMLFGHTTFVVRILSAIFGVLSIYLLYLIGKELNDKKTGIIAALLASVNYFFIYYSQEARAYILLTFLTIFSFYKLIKFLKNNTIKNAIIYGLSLTLMINTHFFGLFVLVAQVVILTVFLFDVEKNQRISYFKNSLIAGIIALSIWYYFAWEIFKIASKLEAFWIPPPTPELITGIFKEFFGHSEALIFIISILTIYYFIKLFNSKAESKIIKNNNLIFGFLILAIWIFITIYIPYLRTYLKIPMITSRYLILVLPAIILLLAISISKIQNTIIRNGVLVFFTIASLTDIFVVKKYYTTVNKTQYREISAKIIEKNTSKSKIVSYWFWHFGYFLKDKAMKGDLIGKSLQDYVNELMVKPDKQAFWYVDAHQRPYALTPEAEKFLADNYVAVENLEYYDTWAKYYVPKAGAENTFVLDINQFEPIKSDNGGINMLLFSNGTTKSKPTLLEAGKYRLAVKSMSLPNPPIQGQNAHLAIAVNGKQIGEYFLDEKEEKINYLNFAIDKKKEITIDLTFGNDMIEGTKDRNALIYSVVIEKVKN
jgi:uncharacterized membrane protein